MSNMNRFERVATEITKRHGVHVEWAPAKRGYVVEGRAASNARKADQIARHVARAANNYAGSFSR